MVRFPAWILLLIDCKIVIFFQISMELAINPEVFDYVSAPDFNWDPFRSDAIREMNLVALFDKPLALYDKTAKGEKPI